MVTPAANHLRPDCRICPDVFTCWGACCQLFSRASPGPGWLGPVTVVVIGGGVLGLMHAIEARRRGHDVVHLERDPGPRGASVRNFGLIWVSGRAPGPELALAQRARTLWEELAKLVPAAGVRPHGSATLAADDAELGLLKEAAELPDAAERGFELLDPVAAAEVNPALRGEFAGALLCRRDAIVEPRMVPGAFRD